MKNLHIQYKRDTGEDVPDFTYQNQKDYIEWLEETTAEAIYLIRYFTDRVEAGTIRSKKTYTQFKLFLNDKD